MKKITPYRTASYKIIRNFHMEAQWIGGWGLGEMGEGKRGQEPGETVDKL